MPFHNWTLQNLQGELAAGRSVVVSLGANGDHEPGHMVTVTGISGDGAWVSYNDPTLGKQVVSRAEFERLWGSQGNSGVAVREEAPAGAEGADVTPWVALAAGLMAAVSGAGLGGLRKGVGGALVGAPTGGGKKKAKDYSDDGGTMSVGKAYKSGKLKAGSAKKASKKKGKKKANKKTSHGPAVAHARILANEDDPPPAPTETQVPAGTTEPEEEATGTPEPERRIGNQIPSTGVPFPDPVRAPHPPGYEDREADIDWPDLDGGWISKGVKAVKSIRKALSDKSLHFNPLESGYVGIVVDDAVEVGEKVAFRSQYGFRGTRYLPSTVAQISGGKLVGNTLSKGSILTAVGASLAANAIDYGFGEDRDKGIASQEFVVSTAVDTVASLAVGFASALVVAAIVAGAAATIGFTVPFVAAAAGTVALGMLLSSQLDKTGIVDETKEATNCIIDDLQENIDSAMDQPIPDHGIGIMGRPFGVAGSNNSESEP